MNLFHAEHVATSHTLKATVSRPDDRGSAGLLAGLRKVGASQDRMLAKARSGRPDAGCNRKQTADGYRSQDRRHRQG